MLRDFGLTHSRTWIPAARSLVAFVASITMLSAVAKGTTRGYFCAAMQEVRDAPCCPRAHDTDAADRGIEAADCDCCGIAPTASAPLAVCSVPTQMSSAPIALTEARGFATAIEMTAVTRKHVTPPTGPPRQHAPRSHRTVFLL